MRVLVKLAITDSFSTKHGKTRQLLTKCAAGANSKWSVEILDGDGDAPCGTVHIHTTMDVYAFVRCVGRVSHSTAGPQISGTLFPRGMLAPKSGGAAGRCDAGLSGLFGLTS